MDTERLIKFGDWLPTCYAFRQEEARAIVIIKLIRNSYLEAIIRLDSNWFLIILSAVMIAFVCLAATEPLLIV